MENQRNAPCPCGSGKKYKKCCLDKYYFSKDIPIINNSNISINDAYAYFAKGEEIQKQGYYEKAISYFNAIKDIEDFPYRSGCYVNIGVCYLKVSNKAKVKKYRPIIEKSFKKAYNIKRSNQSALYNLFNFNILIGNIDKGFDYFRRIKDQNAFNLCIAQLKDVISPFYVASLPNMTEIIPNLEKAMKSYKSEKVYILLAQLYIVKGDHLKALEIYKRILKIYGRRPDHLSTMSLICVSLKQPNSGEEFALEAFSSLSKIEKKMIKDGKEKEVKVLKTSITTNLSLTYFEQGKYKEVVNLLESVILNEPNSGYYTNLAAANLKLRKYNEALLYCNKGLLLTEDDVLYYIKAEINYELKNYSEAKECYVKSIGFLESSNYIKEDSILNETISYNRMDAMSKREMFNSIIQCCIATKDYVSATAYNKIAIEKWTEDSLFLKNKITLQALTDKESDIENVENQLIYVKKELKKEKDYAINQKNKIKQWAKKLILIQNKYEGKNINNINEDELENLELQINHITELLREQNQKENEKELKNLRNKFSKSFPSLHRKSLEFLVTGEFLYKSYKDEHIDYAPIMLEFCKVIELEMNLIFEKCGLKSIHQKCSLGSILYNIEKTKINELKSLIPTLKTILKYRNGSAHTGSTTKEKVKKVRGLLFHDNWLNVILQTKYKA